MNVAAINYSIPTLSRMLAVALLSAAWRATKTIARVSLRVGDEIITLLGAFTLMCYYYALAGLLFLHEHLTSMQAMRRYKRWIVTTYHYIDHNTTVFGEWSMNKFYLRGSLGQISLDVHEEEADGYVIVRQFGDAYNVPVNFYCENRWLMRKGVLHGRNIFELHTRVMDNGLNISRIVLGEKMMTPYAPLPEIQLPEVMSWKPAMELPNPRSWAPADILTRVA